MADPVRIAILADGKPAQREVDKFSKGAQNSFGDFAKNAAKLIAGAFVVGKIVDWGKGVVDEFQAIEDDMGRVGVDLGEKAANELNDTFADMAHLGLSKGEAAQLGAMFSPLKKSASETAALVTRTADIVGATGLDQVAVAKAVEGAERGKGSALEKILGLQKGQFNALVAQEMKTKGLTEAEARHQVVMKQTSKYQGEAAKDAETLGGQVEIVTAMWDNFGQSIAQKVMPYIILFAQWVTGTAVPAVQAFATEVGARLKPYVDQLGNVFTTVIIPKIAELVGWVQNNAIPALAAFGGWIVQNKDWLLALAIGVGTIVGAITLWQGALTAWQAVTKIATGIQAAFNVVMSANPIGIVILAIAALVAGLVYFFTQTDTGRKIWSSFISWLQGAWRNVSGFFSDTWTKITGFFTSAGTATRSAWDGVVGFFQGIPDKIKAVFTGAKDWLGSVGENIVRGLWDGVNGMVGWIKDKLRWFADLLPQFVKDALGINSPSKVFELDVGRWLPAGVAVGVDRYTRTATASMGRLATRVAASFDPDVTINATSGTVGGGRPIIINVQGALDRRGTANTIRDLLTTDARVRGAVTITETVLP